MMNAKDITTLADASDLNEYNATAQTLASAIEAHKTAHRQVSTAHDATLRDQVTKNQARLNAVGGLHKRLQEVAKGLGITPPQTLEDAKGVAPRDASAVGATSDKWKEGAAEATAIVEEAERSMKAIDGRRADLWRLQSLIDGAAAREASIRLMTGKHRQDLRQATNDLAAARADLARAEGHDQKKWVVRAIIVAGLALGLFLLIRSAVPSGMGGGQATPAQTPAPTARGGSPVAGTPGIVENTFRVRNLTQGQSRFGESARARLGDTLEFEKHFTNLGNTASAVVLQLRDSLAPGLTFVEGSMSFGAKFDSLLTSHVTVLLKRGDVYNLTYRAVVSFGAGTLTNAGMSWDDKHPGTRRSLARVIVMDADRTAEVAPRFDGVYRGFLPNHANLVLTLSQSQATLQEFLGPTSWTERLNMSLVSAAVHLDGISVTQASGATSGYSLDHFNLQGADSSRLLVGQHDDDQHRGAEAITFLRQRTDPERACIDGLYAGTFSTNGSAQLLIAYPQAILDNGSTTELLSAIPAQGGWIFRGSRLVYGPSNYNLDTISIPSASCNGEINGSFRDTGGTTGSVLMHRKN